MSDEELQVELRDIRCRLAALDEALSHRIADQQRRVRKILNAVMESDEHTANMGREAPNDLGVAPDFQSLTHEVALDEDDVEEIERCGE